jgi:shikimate kinase
MFPGGLDMTSSHHNIVLAGFMGTGKSTIGRLVADKLNMTFVETDAQIEALAGLTIPEIFAQHGEPLFRQMEASICQQAAAGQNQVISTGGGALLNPKTREIFISSGLVICLKCDLDEIIRRVGSAPDRPLFVPDRERLERLFAPRADLYNSLPYQIDTTQREPAEIVEEVLYLWLQNT